MVRLPVFRVGLCLALPLAAGSADGGRSGPALAGLDEITRDFEAVPCDNVARLAAVRALYERMGAPSDGFRIDRYEDRGGVENLVLVMPGASPQMLVVGAHYDKTADGCGAVDNWSGQVAVARLYQTLRDVRMEKTLVFVAFGGEERGLVGSRAMAKAIPVGQRGDYCAMLNIDSLGLARPQVADNMSSRPLAQLAADTAREMGVPFAHAAIPRANSDSSAFIENAIPAVTLHGLDHHWTRVLHSHADQPARINAASVLLGYRLALSMLARMDQAPCDAWR